MRTTWILAFSIGEHLPQNGEGRLWIDCGHPREEPFDRHGADLVEGHRCGFSLEANRIAGRKIPDGRGNRRKDYSPEGLVHFIRGDHESRAGFPDFPANGRVERNPVDLAAAR